MANAGETRIPAGKDASNNLRPGEIHDIPINTKSGRSDIVAAIFPQEGDTITALVKKLHPRLSEEQLALEVNAVIAYNKDYDNNLGDGTRLSPSKPVYLTSVKYRNGAGQITRIEGPTGRITTYSYESAELSGFKITEANGSLVDDLHKEGSTWKSEGGARQANQVEIDSQGNVSIEETDGNRTAHLTRGEEVLTRYKSGRATESLTLRSGKETVRFGYDYPEGKFTPYALFPGKVDSVKLNDEETSAWLQRLRAAGVYNG